MVEAEVQNGPAACADPNVHALPSAARRGGRGARFHGIPALPVARLEHWRTLSTAVFLPHKFAHTRHRPRPPRNGLCWMTPCTSRNRKQPVNTLWNRRNFRCSTLTSEETGIRTGVVFLFNINPLVCSGGVGGILTERLSSVFPVAWYPALELPPQFPPQSAGVWRIGTTGLSVLRPSSCYRPGDGARGGRAACPPCPIPSGRRWRGQTCDPRVRAVLIMSLGLRDGRRCAGRAPR